MKGPIEAGALGSRGRSFQRRRLGKNLFYILVPAPVARTLAIPRGPFGWISGHVMAVLNADMNRGLIGMLEFVGNEQVLEVGFGPGIGIRLLSEALPQGHIAGIDPSPTMFHQAARRNQAAIRAGKVELQLGSVSSLGWPDGSFDVVCSVDSIHLWDSLDEGVREVHRVLRPGGRFAVSVHGWVTPSLGDDIDSALAGAGFDERSVRQSRRISGVALDFLARA